MSTSDWQQQKALLLYKNVAAALLFSVLLGPVGLLYSSWIGGTLLILLCFAALGNKYYAAFGLFWVLCSVWSVVAVNRHNARILKKLETAE